MIKKGLGYTLLIFMLLAAKSCGVYSFSGASIPPEAKTISIQFFPNRAPLVVPTLSQEFTDALKDIFSQRTQLVLVEQNGDLQLEGEITQYSITPVSVSSGNSSSGQVGQLNRINIGINVRFTNKYDPSSDFESTFSQYVDVKNDVDLSNPTNQIQEINERLVEDIFNKSVVNW
ncbi:MAG: LptE family protein [Hyphomicrobiales bacterium]